MKNGSFDRDLSGWTLGSGEWALDEPGRSGAAKVINPTYRYNGPEVSSARFGIWQCVKIYSNQEYELLVRSRMSRNFAKLGYGAAELTWFSTPNCYDEKRRRGGIVGSPASVELTAIDGGWHELTLAAGYPPQNARSVEIALSSVATDLKYKNPIEVWFDDVVFTAAHK